MVQYLAYAQGVAKTSFESKIVGSDISYTREEYAMNCSNCGNALSDNLEFCNFCGAPIQMYSPPDGFLHDPNSGFYYRMEYDGSGVNIGITWFNAMTGEYQQVRNEQEPAPAPTPAPTPAPEPEAADKHQKQRSEKKPKDKKKKSPVPVIIVIVLVLGAAAGVYFTGLYEKLPFIAGEKTELTEGVATAGGDVTVPAFTTVNDGGAALVGSPTIDPTATDPTTDLTATDPTTDPITFDPSVMADGHQSLTFDTANSTLPLLLESVEYWRKGSSLIVSVHIPPFAQPYSLWLAHASAQPLTQTDIDTFIGYGMDSLKQETEMGYEGYYNQATLTMDLPWNEELFTGNLYMLVLTHDQDYQLIGHTVLVLETAGMTVAGISEASEASEIGYAAQDKREAIAPIEGEITGEVPDLTTAYDYGEEFYQEAREAIPYFPNGKWLRADGKAALYIEEGNTVDGSMVFSMTIVDDYGSATFIEKDGMAYQHEASDTAITMDGTRIITGIDSETLKIISFSDDYQWAELNIAGDPSGIYTLVRALPTP
jgi:hypothetical protein